MLVSARNADQAIGTVISISANGVAAMTGDSAPNPILLTLRCSGLGYAEKDAPGSADFYCSFMENETDQFDVKGTDNEGETKITVIGGSGRWAGATGSGTVKRTSNTGDKSRATFDLTITTP